MGCWNCHGDGKDSVTPLTSLKAALNGATIKYAKGLPDSRSTSTSLFQEAITAASSSEVVIMIMGEDNLMSGEANCRTELGLPGAQE